MEGLFTDDVEYKFHALKAFVMTGALYIFKRANKPINQSPIPGMIERSNC